MEHLIEIGIFVAKTLIIVAGVIVVLVAIFNMAGRGRERRLYLEVERLNKQFASYKRTLQGAILGKKDLKKLRKSEKKDKSKPALDRKVYVLDFDGDIRANAVEHLREEISAVLSVATPTDEVVVRVESPGGMVPGYGLAAAQLRRVRDKGVPLTVCVDKVAASGGYMMACVADKILAAPFAIVGSVGVVASIPNVHRVLEKHDVQYHEVTAGEFKRTVSVFGEITPQGFAKFKDQIEDTHALFKAFVHMNRPKLDIGKIATGEYWFATRAIEMGLVDELKTSDEYLWSQHESSELLKVKYYGRKSLADRISHFTGETAARALDRVARTIMMSRFGI